MSIETRGRIRRPQSLPKGLSGKKVAEGIRSHHNKALDGSLLVSEVDFVSLRSMHFINVCLDSRRVEPNSIFIAAAGATKTSAHGGEFVDSALQKGATLVLLEHTYPERASVIKTCAQADILCLLVDAPRALAGLLTHALFGNPAEAFASVGVTGTNGKTTVAWLFSQIAARLGEPGYSVGTLGHGPVGDLSYDGFTTPEASDLALTINAWKQTQSDAQSSPKKSLIMEVSSIALETSRVAGLAFDVGILTQLGSDHLDVHQTLERYYAAKRLLFSDYLKKSSAHDSQQGKIVYPEALRRHAFWDAGCDADDFDALSFGETSGNVQIALKEGKSKGMRVTIKEDVFELDWVLAGAHNRSNLAACLAAWVHLGRKSELRSCLQEELTLPPGRLERVKVEGQPEVWIDFAHSPDALETLLTSAREVCNGRLWVLFGCGGNRDAQKRPEMGRVASLADVVVVCNDNPRDEDPSFIAASIVQGFGTLGHACSRVVDAGASKKSSGTSKATHSFSYVVCLNRRDAIRESIHAAGPDDIVVVAGKGHETTQEVAGEKFPFSDRGEVEVALST